MKRLSLPVIKSLTDGFARRVSYLRVSLTDRCNYRCTYCMPDEGMEFKPRSEILTFEEIERIVGMFAEMGVRRVRLTGGEPTVRANVVDLVARVAAVPGIRSVVMTSNGHLLPELAAPLAQAGLREVNVSIDTLEPDTFRRITRRGDVHRVIAGVDAAVAAGLVTKLNAVALYGTNEHEIGALCAFAWERGVTPRFIEHMPMSDGQLYAVDKQLTAAEIRARVAQHIHDDLVPDDRRDSRSGDRQGGPSGASTGRAPDSKREGHGGGHRGTDHGPARYWRPAGDPPDTARRVGIISAMSEHFCDTCNRLRLSATGALHACLAYDDAVSLRDILRAGGSDDDMRRAVLDALAGKRAGHVFQTTGAGAPSKHMIAIGG